MNQKNQAPDASEPMVPNGKYSELRLGGSSSATPHELDLFLCRASGEGTQDFRLCKDEAAVFAFYEEMGGRDQDGTLNSITESFADIDQYWTCDGRSFSIDLYMAQFEVWKVSPIELALSENTQQRWILVKEKRPAVHQKIFFMEAGSTGIHAGHMDDQERFWCFAANDQWPSKPWIWMPAPLPPVSIVGPHQPPVPSNHFPVA